VRAAVEAHLRTCPTCPPLYAALVGVHARLGALRDPDAVVPEALGRRINALLVAHQRAGAVRAAGA
jgi:predicted anti-sigma-YlaC factor YlaD